MINDYDRAVIKPVGFASKQDLLTYNPVFVCYATRPEAGKGYEPVPLYTRDQVDWLLEDCRTPEERILGEVG